MTSGGLDQRLRDLPDQPGCYRFVGAGGKVLYVGKATSLRSRVRSYFQAAGPKGRSTWIHRMLPLVADIEVMVTNTPLEALLLECNLIKQCRPPFNTRLTDDKHYPYISLTWEEEFPRLNVVRRVLRDGNQYFGPYSNARAMRNMLDTVRRIFGVCTCKPGTRDTDSRGPCLQYHLGYCAGPCFGAVSAEEYRDIMKQVARFLNGHTDEVLRELKQRMQAAADDMEFERAAKIRDRVRAIEETAQRQAAISTDLSDYDVIGVSLPWEDEDAATIVVMFVRVGRLVDQQAFVLRQAAGRDTGEILGQFLEQYYERAALIPREILVESEPQDLEMILEWLARRRGAGVTVTVPKRGEKCRLVELARENALQTATAAVEADKADRERGLSRVSALRQALGLEDDPRRIECYDISTLHGRESVGSMVVFHEGRPASGEYRMFSIRRPGGPDDYAMMREVLRRRFSPERMADERFASEPPELVVVDGGKGQLGCALEVMRELGLNLPLAALAKRNEEVYLPGRASPLMLDERGEALALLMHIRDEAHRFAVTYHRRRRSRAQTKSVLDDIPGIGPKRKRALLERFRSVGALCSATVDEVASVPGITTKLADELLHRLRPPGAGVGRRADRAPVPREEELVSHDERGTD